MRVVWLAVLSSGCMLSEVPNAGAALCVTFDRFDVSEGWDQAAPLSVRGTVVEHRVDPVPSASGFAGVRCTDALWHLGIETSPGEVFDLWYGHGTARDDAWPLDLDTEVDLSVYPVLSFGTAMGAVIEDEAGVVAALDVGTWGRALSPTVVKGLTVSDGDAVGLVRGDCGTQQAMRTRFVADKAMQVAPVGHASLNVQSVPMTAYALTWSGFVETTCTDVAAEQSWAVVRD